MSELSVGQIQGLPVNSNVVTVPAGHTLYAPGHVIQVVSTENALRTAQSYSASTFIDVSNMEASITPKKTNSKILIQVRWFGEMTSATIHNSVFGLTRNGTQIGRQTDPGATVINGITSASISHDLADFNSTPEMASFFVTDSPNTTSPISYKLTYIADGAGTLYTNRTLGWSGQATGFELGTSGIVLMEIAA